ncbi:MAG TPA: cupin domain-containing protein [Planctomycetota bacterium]|nr:cupin domain-containing protein [Planctomycetota bacterium]
MDVKSVMDARKFSAEKLSKISLFESEKMFCDVYGVSPGQEQKTHTHDGCDKIYYVIEGCGHFRVGGELREVGEKNVVYVPSGVEHAVKNEGASNLTLLVMMTPHPNYVVKKV